MAQWLGSGVGGWGGVRADTQAWGPAFESLESYKGRCGSV